MIALLAVLPALAGCTLWASSDKPATITVVDYNILHGLYDEDPAAPDFDRFADRLDLLAQELARIRPDVVVLQEFVMEGPKGYPDVGLALRAALGEEYTMVFGEAGNGAAENTLGRMTLTRLPVVSSVNRAIYRGRTAHRVTVQVEGGVVDIYNVHMEGPELIGVQELEIVKLLTFIDDTARNQNPVILTGDFNSRPGDTALLKVEQYGYSDVGAQMYDVTCSRTGDPGCTRALFPRLVNSPANYADIRIDYMFARDGLDIGLRAVSATPFMNSPMLTESRELLWVSDHIGIQATFEIVRQPSIGPRPSAARGAKPPAVARQGSARPAPLLFRLEDIEVLRRAV